MFVGGFPVAGARYGVPDIGLKGFTDIAAAVRDIIAACDVPVLVDIDDGYGDVKNAVHTVQAYERMGASAVFLEDQAWPKRCGHMAGKKVVPAEAMEAKIRATMAERLDAETLICVRTDARAVLGFDEALRRAERYVRAGAEAIFVEAPESVAELEHLARSFDVPQFANPLVGGRTPILSPKEFEQLGFNAICFGLETIMHAAKAMKAVLEDMRSGTFALRDKGMGFEEFKTVVHYDRWDRIDNLYGAPLTIILRAARLERAGPVLGLALDELSKILRRCLFASSNHLRTQRHQASRARPGYSIAVTRGGVELLHDGGRRILSAGTARSTYRPSYLDALLDRRRQVLHHGRTRGAEHRQALEAAVLDQRLHGSDVAAHEVDAAAKQVLRRRCRCRDTASWVTSVPSVWLSSMQPRCGADPVPPWCRRTSCPGSSWCMRRTPACP